MKSLKRISISISVAIVTMAVVMSFLLAVVKENVKAYTPPYIVTDGSLFHYAGSNPGLTLVSSSGCRGSYCRVLNQVSSNASYYGWEISQNDIIDWYAYDPTIGQAAVKYLVTNNQGDAWNQVMDQSNSSNKGTFVYIGYSDHVPNTGSYFVLGNGCVSGWGCFGYPVYWDDMGYTR